MNLLPQRPLLRLSSLLLHPAPLPYHHRHRRLHHPHPHPPIHLRLLSPHLLLQGRLPVHLHLLLGHPVHLLCPPLPLRIVRMMMAQGPPRTLTSTRSTRLLSKSLAHNACS